MAQIPDTLKSKLDRYLRLLEDSDLTIDQAWLFGSYAAGTATEYSDIDIALVSGSFTGNPFVDIELLLEATVEVDGMLENHTFPSNATALLSGNHAHRHQAEVG